MIHIVKEPVKSGENRKGFWNPCDEQRSQDHLSGV